MEIASCHWGDYERLSTAKKHRASVANVGSTAGHRRQTVVRGRADAGRGRADAPSCARPHQLNINTRVAGVFAQIPGLEIRILVIPIAARSTARMAGRPGRRHNQ